MERVISSSLQQYEDYLNSLSDLERKELLAQNRLILLKGGKCKKLPKKVYHMSPKQNADSINKNGILKNVEGAIFVCPTIKDLIIFKRSTSIVDTLIDTDYEVWEIDTKKLRKDRFYVNKAYNRSLINAKSLIYLDNDIPVGAIKHLSKNDVTNKYNKECATNE